MCVSVCIWVHSVCVSVWVVGREDLLMFSLCLLLVVFVNIHSSHSTGLTSEVSMSLSCEGVYSDSPCVSGRILKKIHVGLPCIL